MKVFEYQLQDATSMGASFNGNSQQLIQMAVACIQAVWTGTPTGTLKLQLSNDNTNWTDYTGSSASTGGGAGDIAWNVTNVGFQYIRIVYTRTSGTGTISATISGKGV